MVFFKAVAKNKTLCVSNVGFLDLERDWLKIESLELVEKLCKDSLPQPAKSL